MTRPIDTFLKDRMPFDQLEALAARARDGSVEDFNDFVEEVTYHMTEEQTEAWDEYSMKATGPEIVDEAMRLARSNLA